ncbi:hypothetical protein LWI29_021581 [Acer saccharum]|uniref:Non-haem dioxygenase N-terminal domain-containing protein n=1 Tax=Acer saccharum TaxID=4024 RepID=A0AA39RWT8_ACESA|nr:hypothetical protein LWI29_021581 [Acer saccharum]
MPISLGRTLAVPFVQELAKKGLTSVPPRYVHHDQDPPIISLDSCSPQVPVIDMQRLLFEDFMDSELQKLDQACREWGFFQYLSFSTLWSLHFRSGASFWRFCCGLYRKSWLGFVKFETVKLMIQGN